MLTATELSKKHCKPCEGGVPPLAPEEVCLLLDSLEGWHLSGDGKRLHKEWRVKDFAAGLDFFRQVGEVAEAENHHPDLHLVGYRDVTIELSTHAVGGLTDNDFILAARIDRLPVELKR